MLSASRFNGMLNKMGQQAQWRRGYECPCRDPHSGAADPFCPACGGKGITWGESVTATVAIAGQKVQQEWAKLGMYESGDMVVTIPSDSAIYSLGQFDRLVMVQSSVPFSRVLTHDGTEVLPFAVERIERASWLEGGAEVDGGLPMVLVDGSLSWSSSPPPVGRQYSLTGRQRPEYFALRDFPQDRAHFGGQPLPRRVVLRLMDLFGR